jgi:hypothetical protein
MLRRGWFEKMLMNTALRQSVCSSLLEPHFGSRTISWGERLLALRTRIAAGVPFVGDGSLALVLESDGAACPLPEDARGVIRLTFRKARDFRNAQSVRAATQAPGQRITDKGL